jgi:hypothetical protein
MSGRDLGASVRQRLLNQARLQGRPFQELLQYFAMERFLYRLAKSPFADRFILKGALLLTAWRAPVARPTMDIDLAGKTNNELEHIRSLVGEVCEFATEPDGIEFTAASIEVQRIKEDAEYEGVRVRFQRDAREGENPDADRHRFWRRDRPATNRDRVPGDAGIPAASAHGLSKGNRGGRETRGLTVLGLLNSRIKDYYDLALLARLYPFDGDLLAEAIRSTFRHRGTAIDATPVGLTEAFSADPARAVQWRAFVRRSRFESESGLDEISATHGDRKGGRLPFEVEAWRTVGVIQSSAVPYDRLAWAAPRDLAGRLATSIRSWRKCGASPQLPN